MWNFDWPKAYPETNAQGILKLKPEDFQVDEIPLMIPAGEGEHICLHITYTYVMMLSTIACHTTQTWIVWAA